MADYYSILKKTIASLPENNGAARRSVYSRARNAIVNQLKAYEPALSPSEITAEQLRLEEAIRKVEAEAARESLGLMPQAKPAPQPSSSEPKDTGADVSPPIAEPVEQPKPAFEAPAVSSRVEPELRQPHPPVSLASPLKDVVEEAGNLGEASHQAVQNTKDAMAVEGPSGRDKERQEPAFSASSTDQETEDDDLADGRVLQREPLVSSASADNGQTQSRRKSRDRQRASATLPGNSGKSNFLPIALVGILMVIVLVIAGVVYSQRDMVSDMMAGTSSEPETSEDTAPVVSAPVVETAPAKTDEASDAGKNEDRLLDASGEPAAAPDARTVTTTVITPGEQSAPRTVIPAAPTEPETATPEALPPMDAPEVAAEDSAIAAVTPDTAKEVASIEGAQKSILYEEGEDANGAGTASQGTVVWSVSEAVDLEGVKQSVLSAVIEIPERNVSVDIQIKPNDDKSLPASHLVEIKFDFPKDFPAGEIVNVPGLVMKPTEEARGDALIGASVKVSPGYFWIALSSIESEMERNMGLLRERGWIDIPMLYENGKRGILTLEKGADGTAAVEKAVAAWQAAG
ncbi:hypothetical protein [Roseibium algae]|uniref:CheA signal transduction histidine kinase n=1 Tax=Roseibium algae TaxID=3123038 RepID=A0ABU8TFU7_9HYPH